MNKLTLIRKVLSIFSISMILVFSLGCDKSESSDTAVVALQYGSYTTVQNKIWNLFMPKAHAAVSSLKFCFKRLRFKMADQDSADPAVDNDNIDFSLGEVDISQAGTSLGAIALPVGTYRRVEFDLENDCASGYSVQLSNDNGSFNSTERITLKWQGELVIADDSVVTLDTQAILNQLNSHASGSLKTLIEATPGTLQ